MLGLDTGQELKEMTHDYCSHMCSLHLTSGPDEVVNGHPWLLKPPLGQASNVLLPQQGAELHCCVLQVGRLGHTYPDFASQTGYLKWHHITLVQVQEEVEVGHGEGKVLQGLLVVVHSQLMEVLGGWGGRKWQGCADTQPWSMPHRFLGAEFPILHWKWVSIFPTR